MRIPLTPSQSRVYEAIQAVISDTGICPSFQELCDVTGLSSLATVHKHVQALESKGWITRNRNGDKAIRAIRLVQDNDTSRLDWLEKQGTAVRWGVIASGRDLRAEIDERMGVS